MSDPGFQQESPLSCSQGIKLGYTIYGTSGPMIAVTHGWAADSCFTAPLVDLFPNFRIMLIDLPGYGLSEELYDYAGFNDTVALLKNTIPSQSILMSWSLSTLYAIRLCSLKDTPVQAFITVCGSARFPDEAGNPGFPQKYIEKLRRYFNEDSATKLLRLFYSIQAQGQCGELIKQAFGKFRIPSFDVLYTGLQHMFYADERPCLQEITIPMLKLYGRNDLLVPSSQASLQAPSSSHSYHIFEDSAHLPFISEKQAFTQVVDTWLQRVIV